MWRAVSFAAISRTPSDLPVNWNAELRETTRGPSTLARALMVSSVTPSQK
jgi:hypothetical protein